MTDSDINQLIAAMRANEVTRLEWDHFCNGHRLCLTLPDTSLQPPALPTTAPARQIARTRDRPFDSDLFLHSNLRCPKTDQTFIY